MKPKTTFLNMRTEIHTMGVSEKTKEKEIGGKWSNNH